MTRIGVGRVKHTPEQISAKLGHAEALAATGKTQSEICKELGISVMTLHRWRHTHGQRRAAMTSNPASAFRPSSDRPSEENSLARIAELQLENARLRKLVTDLLLKKIKLQEDAGYLAPNSEDEFGALSHFPR